MTRTLLFCPGSERWSIKTLTDTAATLVDYRHPLVRTVAQLAAQDPATLIPPVKILASTPRLPLERIVYRVKVRLVMAKIEGGSLVWLRMNAPFDQGRMPRVGTYVVDQTALDLVAQWITGISSCPQ